MENYKEIARQARIKVLDMIFSAQSSHIGSNFSVIDLMAVLFEKADLKHDKILFSKGWMAATAYYFLAEKGFFPKENLERFCQPGEKDYIGLVEPTVPGVHFAGGSMQFGTAAGVGFALAKKIKREDGFVYVVESDGAITGGMIWESVNIAAKHELDNLVLIIDWNKFCAMGNTEEITGMNPDKAEGIFSNCGWATRQIDGHSFPSIEKSLDFFTTPEATKGKPKMIIANTVKGKGVSWMENENLWHYWHLDKDHYEKALAELRQ